MTLESVKQLSRIEKLKLMEALWEDLSNPVDKYESPAWHEQELADTERRFAEGKEQALDWESAKKALRRKAQ